MSNLKHSDYITHINNEEDVVYLKTKHFPVNMRLLKHLNFIIKLF